MGRVYKGPCCMVSCNRESSELVRMIYTYNNMIYTYEYSHTYTMMKILEGTIIHICLYNIIVIHILIKKSAHNILFFTHNYGNHIAQSFEG